MRVLIQRVKEAHVKVKDEVVGHIGIGLLLFLGLKQGDTSDPLSYFVQKIAHLRLFSDQEGKMNLSLKDIQGNVLIVSQFTLYGNLQKGRRPSFQEALPPPQAKPLYDRFVHEFEETLGKGKVATGRFGALMEVELINDGPVTFLLE